MADVVHVTIHDHFSTTFDWLPLICEQHRIFPSRPLHVLLKHFAPVSTSEFVDACSFSVPAYQQELRNPETTEFSSYEFFQAFYGVWKAPNWQPIAKYSEVPILRHSFSPVHCALWRPHNSTESGKYSIFTALYSSYPDCYAFLRFVKKIKFPFLQIAL